MQVDLRRAHGKIWPFLVLVLAVLFTMALAFKPEAPVERTPLPALSHLQSQSPADSADQHASEWS
jgi:hypothetical protein